MTSETHIDKVAEQAAAEERVAWQAFQFLYGSRGAAAFRASFRGRFANRDAFGQELLRGLGADARLFGLPPWLRAYIRLDGAAVVADFEAAGHFQVFDAPEDGGSYVFEPLNRYDNAAE